MLGGNHFKKKLAKAKKVEARRASREKTSGKAKKPSKKAVGGGTCKGPVVKHDGSSRDSANDRRNVPFANKVQKQLYDTKHRGQAPRPEGVKTTGASSAAQRRRVLRRRGDDDLLDHFREKLNASTFRLLNEQVYNSPNAFAAQLLSDPGTFRDYHTGYQQQLEQWPMNPNQLIIDALLGDRRGRFPGNKGKAMPGNIPPTWVVADMGCGEAHIAAALQTRNYTVHSFDFCALNDRVTVADTAAVPLSNASVDVCVFSLSLMATDYEKSLFEAFRILKPRRLLKIVEVRSRIPYPWKFAKMVESMGFDLDFQDVAGDYFVSFDFIKKEAQAAANTNVAFPPGEVLLPSLYKKR